MQFRTKKRGAIPSARHELAAAMPHQILCATPAQFILTPAQISFWNNQNFGCCVTSEEAFAKACMKPEIFIADETVLAWATKHDGLNGQNISTVLGIMQLCGFRQDGQVYCDGPHSSVDWTNDAQLQNAIATNGPVKIGVAADQLQTAVEADGDKTGWLATGFQPDTNLDHCVSVCGFGTIEWLAQQLESAYGVTVNIPAGVDASQPAYAMFTWDSIGIIDVPSLRAITGEAWVRSPVTLMRAAI